MEVNLLRKKTGLLPICLLLVLAANPLPFDLFDVSGRTKRGTLFSIPKTGQGGAFLNLTTSSKLAAAAKAANCNQKFATTNVVSGVVVYFVTPENKYGALLFNATETDFTDPFFNVSIKTQQ
ncbi:MULTISPECIES: hypothetical protein [Niastella]|uniref:Legume lectin domain-containing protein n=1 Tax=Niastella soli TaxID=2821487 RepID=A0ABS3Z3T0_9BACT|nr:hypothetical protein [Niastella soli]MBO9204387.1 hypothetical protein [Niastella soli]